jgi:hypothetical protein
MGPRISLFVLVINYDLSGMEDIAESNVTAGITFRIL